MTQIIPIPLKWSNAYLIKGERPVLVDTGSPNDTARLLRAFQKAKIAPSDLALIVHTHGHHDHCGCTWEMKKLSKAPTAIHQMDRPMLQSGRNGRLIPTRFSAWLMKSVFEKERYKGLNATIIIKDEMRLDKFGIPAMLIFTPGHTVGSISIVTDAGEAVVGDLLMGGYLGGQLLKHRPRYHYYAYDLTVIHWSLKKLMRHNPQRLYVGHGGPLEAKTIINRFKKDIDF
ncbi:MBL fold metallo-hydrolase [Anaerolineales bacterium HSG6]|nr:MBL fold metallo-hydrolase [Anaerolineales bacterium HSG6]